MSKDEDCDEKQKPNKEKEGWLSRNKWAVAGACVGGVEGAFLGGLADDNSDIWP